MHDGMDLWMMDGGMQGGGGHTGGGMRDAVDCVAEEEVAHITHAARGADLRRGTEEEEEEREESQALRHAGR